MSMTLAESAAVVGELRKTRRRQRVSSIHWVDALYQVYITGLVAIVAMVFASAAIGDGKVSPATLVDVRAKGAAVVGLLASLAVFAGLRSGSRGGPLALEQPDVRHVLLSPVDRGVALRGPAWRQIRFLAAIGAAVGATTGQLALRRLPGNPAEWMVMGAVFGLVVVGLGFGSALVAAGTGLRSWAASLMGGALVVWSVGDILDRLPTAPGSIAGRLALWPLRTDPLALAGVVAALAAVGAGMRLVSGTSLEAAERRTALVGQLRFAVTLQDLRTVLVLRRQLAQERPRSRPWVRGLRRSARFPVLQRGVRSLMRWPLSRIVRVALLATVAGFAFRGVWGGTTPLLLLAGLALWVAALDAVEPLGQEIDHPGRTDGYPIPRGHLLVQHLPIVALVSMGAGLLAGLVAAVPIGRPVPLGVALLVGASTGLLAACGAVVSVIQGAPDAVDVLALSTPEIAGSRTVIRTAWPPGLAILGSLPLLAARAAERGISDPPPVSAAVNVITPLVAVAVLVGGWVRFHDEIHEWMRNATEQMSPTKAMERAAAEREATESAAGSTTKSSKEANSKPSSDAKPRPASPAKPKVKPAPAGVQGGNSSKPIGRKRDQK
ncbi:MAG: hypothetical protein ABIP03_10595 [Aquihabitans sp.]